MTDTGNRIAQLCDSFEKAWLNGERPELRKWLDTVDPEFSKQPIIELANIDIEYRVRLGESVAALRTYVSELGVDHNEVSLVADGATQSQRMRKLGRTTASLETRMRERAFMLIFEVWCRRNCAAAAGGTIANKTAD